MVSPPVFGLELGRKLEEEILASVGGDELQPDGQPVRRSGQWKRDRRLAGDVERLRQLAVVQGGVLNGHQVLVVGRHLAETRSRPKTRRGQQDVEAISPPLCRVATKRGHRLLGRDHRCRVHVGGPVGNEARPRFDIAVADLPADCPLDRSNAGCGTGDEGGTPRQTS